MEFKKKKGIFYGSLKIDLINKVSNLQVQVHGSLLVYIEAMCPLFHKIKIIKGESISCSLIHIMSLS